MTENVIFNNGTHKISTSGAAGEGEKYYGTVITRFALRNRMSFGERVELEIQSQSDPEVRVLDKDLSSAKYIDLTQTEVVQGIYMLEQKQVIGAGRADTILTTPVTKEEAYKDEL